MAGAGTGWVDCPVAECMTTLAVPVTVALSPLDTTADEAHVEVSVDADLTIMWDHLRNAHDYHNPDAS